MRTVRYRLLPATQSKHNKLMGHCHASRFVWNHFVGKLRDEYLAYGRLKYGAHTASKQLTLLRRHYEKWLHAIHIQKIGWCKLQGHNPDPDTKAISGRSKYECGKWCTYIVHKGMAENTVKPHLVNQVGIDHNCGQIALSEGRILHLPNTEKLESRRRYQKQMSRQQNPNLKKEIKPSQCYLQANKRHAKTQSKITQIRTNWCHQVSREIAHQYDRVCVEDLNTKGMTVRAHEQGTAQKRGLNRSILSSGWYKLEHFLSYRTNVTKVPPAYTSQTCSACGAVSQENRKTQSKFLCVQCGHEANANINASLNILAVGIAATARGGGGVSRPVKRECEMIDYIKLST